MMRNRVACALVLVLLVSFYIFYTEYFSYFLLIYALCAIALSAVLFLPGAIFAGCSLITTVAAIRQGDALSLRLMLGRVFPFACVGARVRYTNLMTGETGTEKIRAVVSFKGKSLPLSHSPTHCGLIRCEIELFRAYDLLAVFSLKKRIRQASEVLCMPEDIPLENEIDLSAPGDAVKRSASIDPYGGYDLREYRPGDPIKSVHWKASAKTGELYVKETNNDTPNSIVLGVDIAGCADEADLIIAHASAFAKDMIKRRIPFLLLFTDGSSHTATHTVETEDDCFRGMRRIMSHPIRKKGDPLLVLAGDMSGKRVFMAAKNGVIDVNNDVLIRGEKA